jgi:hypothetical protein
LDAYVSDLTEDQTAAIRTFFARRRG